MLSLTGKWNGRVVCSRGRKIRTGVLCFRKGTARDGVEHLSVRKERPLVDDENCLRVEYILK